MVVYMSLLLHAEINTTSKYPVADWEGITLLGELSDDVLRTARALRDRSMPYRRLAGEVHRI